MKVKSECAYCGKHIEVLRSTATLASHDKSGKLDYNVDTRCPGSFETLIEHQNIIEMRKLREVNNMTVKKRTYANYKEQERKPL